MLDGRLSLRSRIAVIGAGAATVAALGALGYRAAQADAPSASEARSIGQNVPPAAGAPGQLASPDDRQRWLRSRHSSPSYRSLRKSTGTHKQNRRRLLAGR